MIRLEKISEQDYINSCKIVLHRDDIDTIKKEYSEISIPTRTSLGSAGYDISLPFGINLKAGERICIPTGICLKSDRADICGIVMPRSSTGVTFGMRFVNTTPLIDVDTVQGFGGNQILLFIEVDKDCVLQKGYKFAQIVIVPYLTIDNDNVIMKIEKSLFKKQGYTPWGL